MLFSFPFQLVLLHFRNHLFLVGAWVMLALSVDGAVGGKFGIRYLFMAPEYLGQVGPLSFFLVGIGFGALVMSWNLTTYLLNAYRFSFLACLSRPFTKFTFNNSVIPLAFLVFYCVKVVQFCSFYELKPASEVALNILGLVAGVVSIVGVIAGYFHLTNKDIFSYKNIEQGGALARGMAPGRSDTPILEDIKLNRNQWRVETYLTETLRPRLVRSVAHYDEKLLLKVFRQNHLNALAVQLLTLVVLVLLGAFMESPAARIPTGASIFLLTSVVVAIVGAMAYWFGRWSATAALVLILLINYLTRFDLFHHSNKAYGLNYETAPAAYHPDTLESVLFDPAAMQADKANTIEILENWKRKLIPAGVDSVASQNGAGFSKPKMVLFCVSGGGLKSAVWTMRVLQTADSLTGGQFSEHTILISGASGGMLGASYYRELVLREKQGRQVPRYGLEPIYDISKDLLNPVSFTIVTNDLFLPWATFQHNGLQYKKDRGYIFEKALNENTGDVLDKPVKAYAEPEHRAQIPLVFVTPSIVNDGRRLLISSQPVRYMMAEPAAFSLPGVLEVDAVDFGWMFEQQGAADLRFTTALRMNASYPYILPNVTLPSQPPVEVLDAGFRDNFGLKSATRFVHVFKDWIKENTSGVVIVIVRAFGRSRNLGTNENKGVLDGIFNPLEIAFKVMSLQDYEHDNNLGFIYDLIGVDNLDIVRFTYHPSEQLKDSPISFYITERERKDILQAIGQPSAQASFERLKRLLNQNRHEH